MRFITSLFLVLWAVPLLAAAPFQMTPKWVQKIVRTDKAFMKKAPRWGTLLKKHMDEIKGRENLKPVAKFAKHPSCQFDPFAQNLFHLYGNKILRQDVSGAGESLLKIESYLGCISRPGMRDLDHMFAKFYQHLLDEDVPTQMEGIRATINLALLVEDRLLYTGWSESQKVIHDHLKNFQTALAGELTDTVFCSSHPNGSVLQFNAPSGKSGILSRAVAVVANRNGELGLGLCSMCEMAEANFEGICNRGLQEILQCLQGGEGKAPLIGSGGKGSSASKNSSFPKGPSSKGSSGKTGEKITSGSDVSKSNGQQMKNFMGGDENSLSQFDPLNGMSEGELRALSCGLGQPGQLSGMIDNVMANLPSGKCSVSDIASSLPKSTGLSSLTNDLFTTCAMRYMPLPAQGLRSLLVGETSNVPMDRGCMLSQGNSRVDPREHVAYRTSFERRAETSGGTRIIHLDFSVQVDASNDYQTVMSANMTNPATGSQTPIDPAALNERGDIVPQRDPQSTTMTGNLNVDRNANSRMTTTVMNQARDQGNVTPARSCAANESTTCNQSNVNTANAQEQARADEQRRRRAAQTPPAPPASDPGPEGIDTCTAEGRMMQEVQNCMEEAEIGEMKGRLSDPLINPGEGGGSAPAGTEEMPAGLTCFVNLGQAQDTTNYNKAPGYTDSCMYDGDPTCYGIATGSGGVNQDWMFLTNPGPGDVPESPVDLDNPCPSIEGGSGQDCAPSGIPPGGGDSQ